MELYHRIFAGNSFYMHIPLHLPPPVVAHDNNVWFNLAGVLTDYFLFHHVSDRIKELTHVNKELMELKKKHKE